MKRLLKSLLISALVASAPTVFAQSAANGQPCGWTKLGEATGDIYVVYMDYCKITSTGRYRFAWTLVDYKEAQKDAGGPYFQSIVTKHAFDCQQSRTAMTAGYNYHSNMGKGPIVFSHSFPENQWKFEDSPPGSAGSYRIETVCK
jgi:hypothetical protein